MNSINQIFFQISLESSKKQNDSRYEIENLINLGTNERSLSNLKKSIEHLLEANDLAQRFRYTELQINIFKELYKAYNSINDFENAALFQTRYIQLKDSIYSGDLIKNLSSIQTNFEQRENLKTIRLSNENIKLKDEQLQRQRLQYLFIVLVAILIILLATVLIWANRKQHRHNAALSVANRVIEEQNKALTKTNEELDNRVQEKTRDLVLSNESLTQVNEELDNFIYRTSHDIRGPLVTLKGVCNVAMLDVKDELALDYMNRLDVTAGKLNSILTRLLFVNQINHAELVPTEIDLNALIDNIIKKERSQILPPNFSIEYDVNPSVKLISDRELVGVILENLIDNAIKFYNTSDRISPFVKIMIRKSGPKQVSIQVDDNGIGVNTGDKDQIFHLFVRASERSETGGIGLYLSKLSSQRLGGEITLRDTSIKGQRFLFSFRLILHRFSKRGVS
ncbi:MAG: HAMP domain-containing histidine kinase [Flammeovirgaceae bacterium]|nr:HAMP domain-containing histidine kinase [Flammeovirgaceae bacterium]